MQNHRLKNAAACAKIEKGKEKSMLHFQKCQEVIW